MEAKTKRGGWLFSSGLVVGGIIGAAAGLLMAPRAGSETRAGLAKSSEAWRSRAGEVTGEMRERIGPAVQDMRLCLTPVTDMLGSRFGREDASTGNGDEREAELAVAGRQQDG